MEKKDLRTYFSPIFRTRGAKTDLNLLNPFRNPVELTLFDNWGQAIYAEKICNPLRVEKRLDLARLGTEKYTLVVMANDRRYFHHFAQ